MSVIEAAHKIGDEIRERGDEIEAARRLPADIAQRLAHAGLLRMLVPQDIGGLESEPQAALQAMEILSHANAATGWCTMIASTTGLVAAYLPEPEARLIYGDPDSISGGVFAPTGKAVAEGDSYRVTGRWQWGSGSANCDWIFGGCMIVEDGETRRLPNGAPDSRMIAFRAEDVALIDTWYAVGMSGTGSGDFAVTDLVVPKARSVSLMVDKPRVAGALYTVPIFGLLALGIASVALGNARGAMDELRDLAIAKRRRYSARTVAETHHGQAVMAQCEAEWQSARAYLYGMVATAWAQAQSGAIEVETKAHLRLAATHATRTCAEIVRRMYDLGGGTAVYLTSSLQRRFRDGHVATQHIMVAHNTYETAGRSLFGLETDATFL